MTNDADQIIAEINQMREQWFTEVESGSRRTWPKSIRECVMQLHAMKVKSKGDCPGDR